MSLFMLLPSDFGFEVVNRSVSVATAYRDLSRWADELILISEVFVDWRYCFEVSAPAFDITFHDSFACAAHDTLISHYNVEITESVNAGKTESDIDKMIVENRLHSREAILEKLS